MNHLFISKNDIPDQPDTLPRDILMMLRYEAYVKDINGEQSARVDEDLLQDFQVMDLKFFDEIDGWSLDLGDEWLLAFEDDTIPRRPRDYFLVMPLNIVVVEPIEPPNPYEDEVQA